MTLSTLAAIEWFPLVLSLKVAALATVLALIAGVALGWLFARRPFPGSDSIWRAAFLTSMAMDAEHTWTV